MLEQQAIQMTEQRRHFEEQQASQIAAQRAHYDKYDDANVELYHLAISPI